MTHKNQLIEEMASDMDYATIKHDLWPDDAKEIAKTLIMLGYCKIPKDSVVLPREKYEILKVKEKEKHWIETCMSVWKNAKIDAIRETAKKILNEQYQECKVAEREVLIARGGNKNDDYYKGFSLGMTNTIMHIEELAEQFGVEIQEEDNG